MSNKIKILIVEHDRQDIELMHHELKSGGINYVSEVVQTELAYVHALENFIPDIILADYSFPSFSGLLAFQISKKIAPTTPFIIVSGTIGEERSVELIGSGVTDYVLKDKLFILITKVKRAIKEAKDKQQKTRTEQKLALSETLLARAQQMAHMGNWELDFASNTVHYSDETCRIYGLKPGDNNQSFQNRLRFIHAEDVALVIKKIEDSRNSLTDLSIHYRIVHADNSIRHIYSEGKLEYDANGKPTGLYGIVHDVTEKVLLENKLVQERHDKQSEITAAVLHAQESERANIGKELHDNLNQVLGATKLYIELAKTDQRNRRILLEKSVAYIVYVIGEIRKISKSLASPGKQIKLFDSIKNLLNDLVITDTIKIQFHKNDIDEAALDEKLQLAIFRIIQEQVNNILKHAKATSANITIKRKDNEIILLISDNGEGLDTLKEIDGVGIKNIRSRADLYNGMVTIASKPGKGYELKVALPLTGIPGNPGSLNTIPV